jgi:hypothetical protein
MWPVDGSGAGATPPTGRGHLEVRLKEGWRVRGRRGRLAAASGEEFDAGDRLPEGTDVVATVPDLARASPESLSEDERLLARCAQVIFPGGIDPMEHLEQIRAWPCVEDVELPPTISLPGGPGAL